MITRSSKLSVSFLNTNKVTHLLSFIDEFRRVFEIVIDELWKQDTHPKFIDHKQFSHIETNLSCRALQVILKQASAEIKGTKRSAKRLGNIPTKPTSCNVCPELDYRFVKCDWNNQTSFDCILTLSSLTKDRHKIIVPLKKTSHFNNLIKKGFSLTKGCRFSKKGVTFIFKKEQEKNTNGVCLGIDVGISDVWSDSRGNRSTDVCDKHGHTLSSIMSKLSRRKKGSKNFRQTQTHRDNFIGWSINQLNLTDIKEIKIENIKNMRKGKKCDRFRSHWSYPLIFRKIELKAEEHGVRVSKVDPRNTSRKCSFCDVVNVESRKGKVFKCVACGHTQDADLNAALNILRSDQIQGRGAYSPSNKKTQ